MTSSRRKYRSRPIARYGFWSNNEGGPSDDEISLVASRKIAIAVFNVDRADFAIKLKKLDPGVKVYAYVCLSSTRTWEATKAVAGAVPYNDAVNNNWLALDTTKKPIQWGPYAGTYQCAVWDTAYQAAYISHISTVLKNPLWDGIWADNDFYTLHYYSDALLDGTKTQSETDQKIRDGLDVLVKKAGICARSFGKILMPNYGDGRLNPQRQALHASYGGASNEEMFCAWTNATQPTVYIWGDGDWTTQIGNIRDTEIDGAMTQIQTANDSRTALYGYTSFLMRAQPGDAWTAILGDNTSKAIMPWQTFQDIKVGYPVQPYCIQGASLVYPTV